MKGITRKCLTWMLMLTLMIGAAVPMLPSNTIRAEAKSKVKISSKKEYLWVGETVRLKVKGTQKTVKWASSNKYVATVSKKGVVKAKNEGKATVVAKVAGKKLTCRITVFDEEEDEDDTEATEEDDDDIVTPEPVPVPEPEPEPETKPEPAVDPEPEPEPITPVVQAKNVRYLTSYLKSYGRYSSSDGRYYVTWNYNDFGSLIEYDPSADELIFSLLPLDEYADSMSMITMTTTANTDTILSGKAEFSYVYKTYSAMFRASATINPAEYRMNTNLYFNVDYTNYPEVYTNEKVNELCNTAFAAGMLSWTKTLQYRVDPDMTMRDLGFVNYNYLVERD